MCAVLKALREVTSHHLSASSLHQKRQAVFYYKVVYSLRVFTYFHICIGDRGRVWLWSNSGFESDLDSFFVKCETWLMFSLLYLCVQVPMWSCKISDVCIYINICIKIELCFSQRWFFKVYKTTGLFCINWIVCLL